MLKLDVLLLVAMATLSAASGNEVLPDRFPDLSSEAWVQEAEVAPDGSVFLLGDFTSVDGIPRPGLAKLHPDGRLDTEFAPLGVENLNMIDEFGSVLIGALGQNPNELFALENGGLIRSNDFRFEVRDAKGALDEEALSDLRHGTPSIRPQFEKDGKLWMVSRTEGLSARIVVRDSTTLAPLDGFNFPESFPASPAALSPASNGKVWVLGRGLGTPVFTTGGANLGPQSLYRLNSDGSLDETFIPEDLTSTRFYSIERSNGPGLILTRFSWRWIFISQTSNLDSRPFEFRNAQGIVESTNQITTLRSGFNEHAIQGDRILSYNPGRSTILEWQSDEADTLVSLDQSEVPPNLTALDVFPGGDFLVGGIRRFSSIGQPVANWHVPRLEGPTNVERLIELHDGNVLAIGNFDFAAGVKRNGAICLKPDGSFAPSFNPEIDLRRATQIAEKNNGNLLVLPDHDFSLAQQGSLAIIELDAKGAVLGSIPINFAGSGFSSTGGRFFSGNSSVFFALQPDDSIILKVTSGFEVRSTTTWRIPANDPDNPVRLLDSFGRNVSPTILPDGRLVIGNEVRTPEGDLRPNAATLPPGASIRTILDDGNLLLSETENGMSRFFLWHPDRGTQPGFDMKNTTRFGIFNPLMARAARGKYLVGELFPPAFPGFGFEFFGNPSVSRSLKRLHADGTLDPTFEVTPGSQTTISTFLPRSSNNPTLWVAGNFTEINGVPRQGLAIISDNQASGFQEWMRACAGIAPGIPTVFEEEGDEDGDGFSNLFEYAAGSHPIQNLPLPQGLTKTAPLTWQVSCNPEAPELIRRLEVSHNLIDWRPAQASDLRIESGLRCLSWTLQRPANKLYSRLRITR